MIKGFMTVILAVAAITGLAGIAQTMPVAAEVSECNQQQISNQNHECYWENHYGSGVECTKYDDLSSKTFVVPAAPEGFEYVAAIVKAGSDQANGGLATHQIVSPIAAGDVLTHATGKNLSHVILCYKETPKTADIKWNVDCDRENKVRVTLKNEGDATGEITVNGTVHTLAVDEQKTITFPSGTEIVIFLKEEKVYDKVFTCNQGEVTEANITISYVCDTTKETFVLTLTNSGDAEGTAVVNGDTVTVAAGESKDVTIPAGGSGTHVTVVVDEETVLDRTFVCVLGRGNVQETPVTPVVQTTDVESLPVTSGAGDQAAALVVMIGSILATAGGYALRARTGLSI